MLDRSDLYVRWEEERKRRAAAEAEGTVKKAEVMEGAKFEPMEEVKQEVEGEGNEDEGVDTASLEEAKLGPKVHGLFTVVDTTTGISPEDLI